MKILTSLILTCLMVHTFPANSQGNYKSGFIVDLKGDTLRGSFNNKRWDRNPQIISFKPNGASQEHHYHPVEIRGFAVAEELYTSAIVDVDISPYKIADLSESPLPEFTTDTVFLQSVIQGEKSLFYLKDQTGKSHFYIFDEGYKPLVYKQYIKSAPKSYAKGLFENNQYKTQLALYLKECPDIQEKMKMLKYEVSPILKLFNYYYTCVHKEADYSNARKETELKIGILAGATYTKFNIATPVWSSLKEFNNSVHPSLGFFFDCRLLRTRRLTIANDLFYSSFKTTGEGYVPGSGSFDITAVSDLTFHILKSHHQLRVDLFNEGGLYLSGGVAFAIINEEWQRTISTNPSQTSQNDSHRNKFIFVQLLCLGYEFGKLSSEVRVERVTKTPEYNLSGMHFFLKYRLFPKHPRD